MRKSLLIIQIVFLLGFITTFIASFYAVDNIKEKSKSIISEKIVSSATSKIAFTEELLHSKAAEKYLKNYQIETIREEMESFKTNPKGYVESLTLSETKTVIAPPELNSRNPLKNALLTKIYSWKSDIRKHFNRTFSALITDIRIFIVSNIISLLAAVIICYKQRSLGKRSFAISLILTIVVALSSLTYLSKDWLFSIIINSYAGYGYPLGIAILTFWLCFEYFKSLKSH
ncbi:MAG: hypothetical protein ACRBEE_15750 [Arenicella sp.]